MFRTLRRFTFGHPEEVLVPALSIFLYGVYSMIPAVLAYLGVYCLGALFLDPKAWSLRALVLLSGLMLTASALQLPVERLNYRYTYYPAFRNSVDKRIAYIRKLRELPLGFLSAKESGELINSFSNDFGNLEGALCFWLPYIPAATLLLGLSALCVGLLSPCMAAAIFGPLPVSLLLMGLSGRLRERRSLQVAEARARAATQLNEYLRGMKDLKAFNRTGAGFSGLRDAYRSVRDLSLKAEAVSGGILTFCTGIIRYMTPLAAGTGAWLVAEGKLNILDYIGLLVVSSKLTAPVILLIASLGILRSLEVSARRLDSVMSAPPMPGDGDAGLVTELSFHDVSFAYDRGQRALEHVDLVVPHGKLTALVGPSGSGKSTLLRLMARFWDVTEGTIEADGIDIRTLRQEALLKNVSTVMQDAWLFRDTIRNNLTFGTPDVPEEAVTKACRRARCHDFIMALPEGYDTMVGEGGATLSRGERARIAIARALLKNAPILLLDEPTASLDAENEAMIQSALDELTRDHTVVAIAHRLGFIRGAHRILVLEKGRLTESGTHETLMRRNGLYARLWNLQTAAREMEFRSAETMETGRPSPDSIGS